MIHPTTVTMPMTATPTLVSSLAAVNSWADSLDAAGSGAGRRVARLDHDSAERRRGKKIRRQASYVNAVGYY
jgi:hypothetical protein